VINRNLLIWMLILMASTVSGQDFPSRIWHEGWLVTADKDTVRGSIKYDMESNTVQVLVRPDKVNTYSSKKIMFFEIFDTTLSNYRQFYSIPYRVSSNYKAPILFEVLYEGPMTLLVTEKIVVENNSYNQSYYNPGPRYSRERLAYSYFFVDRKGNMKEYGGKKNEIYEILYKNSDMLKKYIKDNKLRTDKMRDLVRITAFYNSL